MLKKLFPLSYRTKSGSETITSLIVYLVIFLAGSAVRGLLGGLPVLSLAGSLAGLAANIYAFAGIAVLAWAYLKQSR